MSTLAADFASGILHRPQSPCLSLYQPTHRTHPENEQDPIRFRNLVKKLEQSLGREHPTADVRALLEPLHRLGKDQGFWTQSREGLAVLASPELFRVYRLPRTAPELAVVSDSFHTKPLLRMLQSADRYLVLGITRHELRLFEGDRDLLDEIELAPGVPRTMKEALGEELTEPHLTAASYGGDLDRPMFHGHGGSPPEIDIDAERWFRVADKAVLKHHSRPGELPLILAALPENDSVFRRLSQNPHLVPEGIPVDPEGVSVEDLRARAWKILEPRWRARLDELRDAFEAGRSKGLSAADPTDVGAAAAAGRVATLLIEARRVLPGRVDPSSGRITYQDLQDPGVDDLLDDLGELVHARGGKVLVVPSDRMPTDTGLAAILRY